MQNKVLSLTYESSLTDICEVNSSFDSGILRIAYPGENRNKSCIDKETFERCAKTAFNCPLVCHYDRDAGEIGGHDVEFVRQDDGKVVVVNMTTPVGCVPESSRMFWENIEEDDGTVREYFCTDALLWKRQEAYQKIKDNGITAQSMEINVKSGELIDGIYHIYDFEFTAFALIGVEPCFESSSLEVFSKDDFKAQFSEMMGELKESFSSVNAPLGGDDNKDLKNSFTEGGEKTLDKNELITKYEIDADSLDFSIDDFTYEELEEKFKQIQEDKYALISNIEGELTRALEKIMTHREWGECPKYRYVDCDVETLTVYGLDTDDWLLYGFSYSMNGDAVSIDFESKTRMKYAIVDFEGEEQQPQITSVFAEMDQKISDGIRAEARYQEACSTIESQNAELEELRSFKQNADSEAAQAARDEVFSEFEDLTGIEAFEKLKDERLEYDVEALEEKCFAIRGRQVHSAKFNLEKKTPVLKPEKKNRDEVLYGGLFEKYGYTAED